MIKLKVVSKIAGVVYRDVVKSVKFTSQNGELQVLPGHISMLSMVEEGKIVCELENDAVVNVDCSAGFFVINQNECLITVDYAKLAGNNQLKKQAKVA